MTEDSTLEAFAESDGDRATTCLWVPEGRPCAACGARVERLWRREDGLRCADCVAWE